MTKELEKEKYHTSSLKTEMDAMGRQLKDISEEKVRLLTLTLTLTLIEG